MGMLVYTIKSLNTQTVVEGLSKLGFSLQKLGMDCDSRSIYYRVTDKSSSMKLVFCLLEQSSPTIVSVEPDGRGFPWRSFKLKRRLIAALRSLGAVNTTRADLDLIEPPVKKP